jgi:hypothetical protein
MTQNRTRISVSLTPAEFCDVTNACKEGRNFALKYATMAEVWDNCLRSDWLMWIANKIELQIDDRTVRLFAVWCARNTPLADGRKIGDLLTDHRSLAALEVAERFVNGNATARELAAARAAAWAAAAAADAADAAADAAAAAWAAADAAADAARAAAADAARAAARDAARAAAYNAQSAHFRTLVHNPFQPKQSTCSKKH